MTNSWWRPLSKVVHKEYQNQFRLFYDKFGDEGFKEEEGKKILLKIVNRFATVNKNKAIDKTSKLIDILITRDFTIWQWTQNLYELAKDNKTEILGVKGRDNYLRDFGFFDRAPMDRHEWRFIVRTGIFHHHATREKSDPQDRNHLQEALVNFCQDKLELFEVTEINDCLGRHLAVGKNAGMVDLFI